MKWLVPVTAFAMGIPLVSFGPRITLNQPCTTERGGREPGGGLSVENLRSPNQAAAGNRVVDVEAQLVVARANHRQVVGVGELAW